MREIEVLLLDPLPPPLETEIDTVFRVLREAALQDGSEIGHQRACAPNATEGNGFRNGAPCPALLDTEPVGQQRCRAGFIGLAGLLACPKCRQRQADAGFRAGVAAIAGKKRSRPLSRQ